MERMELQLLQLLQLSRQLKFPVFDMSISTPYTLVVLLIRLIMSMDCFFA